MVEGISSISGISGISFPVSNNKTKDFQQEPLHSFDREDTAIISAQAKLLNELEKYNSGEGNEVDLALTSITSRNQVEAQAKVINVKKEMLDTIINMVDD